MKRKVKIYKADKMSWTPFEQETAAESALIQSGIVYVDSYEACDIVVARRLNHLKKIIMNKKNRKKYLIYTSEPNFDKHFEKKIRFEDTEIHIMNVYTRDVWENNYSSPALPRLIKAYSPSVKLTIGSKFSRPKGKQLVTLFACRNDKERWSNVRNGEELDLSYLRTQIALTGFKLGKIDIFGEDWEEGVSFEISRGLANWWIRKWELLQDYHFNLCLENTTVDYYCSEKIWDSLHCGCLPIYYGKGNKIYEDFPPNSFIDYADFSNPKALYDYINNMTFEEYKDRLLKCYEVQERIYEFVKKHYDWKNNVDSILKKLDLIIQEPTSFFQKIKRMLLSNDQIITSAF